MTDFAALRRPVIETQLAVGGIGHPAVLRAMAAVPRERFILVLDAPDGTAAPCGR